MVPAVLLMGTVSFFGKVFCISDITMWGEHGSFGGIIRKSNRTGRPYFAFLGIPYAKPPVGPLRFQAAQPSDPWIGVKDFHTEGAVCPQLDDAGKFIGDENCLFLNVYTPDMTQDTLVHALKPVMVWIHGGSFKTGAGHMENDAYADFLVDEDVVLVTLNYRLGILGFINLGKKEIAGNVGLKDQMLALKWVQNNIGRFGGNPKRVTIFGESAGSVCVHYHMLSPMSKGLFHSAISQSGTALNQFGYKSKKSSKTYGYNFATYYNVNLKEPTESVVEQFSIITAEQIVQYAELQYEEDQYELNIGPTADSDSGENAFLPDTPINIIESGHFNTVPYIVGSNSGEGIIICNWLNKFRFVLEIEPNLIIRQLFSFYTGHDIPPDGIDKIKDMYFRENNIAGIVNLATDFFFMNGIYCTAVKHAENNQIVYVYELTYSTPNTSLKEKCGSKDIPGVPHGEDLIYLFNTDNRDDVLNYKTPEGKISMRMAALWANFARTGDPTPLLDPLVTANWKRVDREFLPYFNINKELSMKYDFRVEHVEFWDNFYQQYAPGKSICWPHFST